MKAVVEVPCIIALVLFLTANRIRCSAGGGGSGELGSCSALNPPFYGALLYNGSLIPARQQPEWRENDVVTIVCTRGYLLEPSDVARTELNISCLGRGTSGGGSASGSDSGWSIDPGQLRCSSIDCRAPYGITDGSVTYDSTDLFSTAQYSCNPGYQIVGGTDFAVCWWDGNWRPNNISCNASISVCSEPPPTIDNGQRDWARGGEAPVGTTVTYTCDGGYNLNGATIVACDITGRWTPPPSCNAEVVLSATEVYAIEGAGAAFIIIILSGSLFFVSCLVCRMKIRQRQYIEDEEALASTGAFTLSNPLVKDEDAAGNPLYLTPDELNEFEQQQ